MTKFTNLSNDEIEKRRKSSVMALKEKERLEFDDWYQEKCDTLYFEIGPCCAGCDHWQSDMGNLGYCTASGIVSGDQVMRSMGITWSSYTPPPGFPLTEADFRCGLFKDDFDWSSLPEEYLRKIGARKIFR